MTTQEKIEAIRQECIRVNPEIVELKFGCVLKHHGYPPQTIYDRRPTLNGSDFKVFSREGNCFLGPSEDGEILLRNSWENQERWRIIGRPITLPDVLLAIQEKRPGCQILVWSSGAFQEFVMGGFKRLLTPGWNLPADDLTQQSEETIDFIHDLLK